MEKTIEHDIESRLYIGAYRENCRYHGSRTLVNLCYTTANRTHHGVGDFLVPYTSHVHAPIKTHFPIHFHVLLHLMLHYYYR